MQKPLVAKTSPAQVHANVVFSSNLAQTQAANEKQIISDALKATEGNAAKAARSLGISPQSFHYKLKKYRLKSKKVLSK